LYRFMQVWSCTWASWLFRRSHAISFSLSNFLIPPSATLQTLMIVFPLPPPGFPPPPPPFLALAGEPEEPPPQCQPSPSLPASRPQSWCPSHPRDPWPVKNNDGNKNLCLASYWSQSMLRLQNTNHHLHKIQLAFSKNTNVIINPQLIMHITHTSKILLVVLLNVGPPALVAACGLHRELLQLWF